MWDRWKDRTFDRGKSTKSSVNDVAHISIRYHNKRTRRFRDYRERGRKYLICMYSNYGNHAFCMSLIESLIKISMAPDPM